MTTLQATAHFCTMRDDIIIPDNNLAAFKYHGGKDAESVAGPYGALKKSLCQSRDKAWTLSNKRPWKLRDSLVEFEEVLSHQTLIHLEWPVSGGQPSSLFVFGNGHIVQLFLDTQTGDPIEIAVDKSLDGKLISEVVSAATVGKTIALAHSTPHLTVIRTNNSVFGGADTRTLSQSEPSVCDIKLPGPGSRQQDRRVSLSPDGSSVCVWWSREGRELYVWTPVVRAEDRANILVYSSDGELLSCHCTEYSVVSVEWCSESALRVTETQSSTKGLGARVLYTDYDTIRAFRQLRQRTVILSSLVRCHSYSPDGQLLAIGCVDNTLVAWNLQHDTHISCRLPFIAFHISWHGSGALLVVSSERGQLQVWDRALNPVPVQLRSSTVQRENSTVLHLQQYLRQQSCLVGVKWQQQLGLQQGSARLSQTEAPTPARNTKVRQSGRKKLRPASSKRKHQLDRYGAAAGGRSPAEYLLLCFERGPVLMLRFLTGCWPASCSLGSLAICSEYVSWRQFQAAIQLLLSLNWSSVSTYQEEDELLSCLSRVVDGLLRLSHEWNAELDKLLERVFVTLSEVVKDDEPLLTPVLDCGRRSCRVLLRMGRLHSAAVYAFKLMDADLLIEVILRAKIAGDATLESRASHLLDLIRDEYSSSCSSITESTSDDTCSTTSSGSSCSTCDGSQVDNTTTEMSRLQLGDGDQVHVISFGQV